MSLVDDDDDRLLMSTAPAAGVAEGAPEEGDDDAAGAEVDADALAAALSGSDEGSSGSDSDDDAADARDGGAAAEPAEGGADQVEAAAAAGDGGEEARGESAGWASLSKKEAKSQLSKKEYKKWKKKYAKKSKKDKKGKKKTDKKHKKEKASAAKAAAAAKPKKQRQKKYRKDDDDDDAASSAGPASDDEDTGKAKRTSRKTRKSAAAAGDDANATYDFGGEAAARKTSSKPTKVQQTKFNIQKCEAIVEKMREARALDARALQTGGAPIHRIRLVPLVTLATNRLDLHEFLVAAGFLKEICSWMCVGRQLAPLDLRTTALNGLAQFKFEGVSGGKQVAVKKREGIEEIGWDGVTKDELLNTNLGFAANLLRGSPEETSENRAKAAYLLQRLSLAFSGGEVEDVDPASVNKWRFQGDNSVLPPFEPIKSSSESFAARSSKIDPLDPSSYMRVPPLRLQPTYVTGIFNYGDHRSAAARGRPDHEDDD